MATEDHPSQHGASIPTMRRLRAGKIDDELYERLRIRAAKHGVSMEEEVRRILRRAVSAPERLGDLAREVFGDDGVELDLPPRAPHEPMSVGA